MTGLNLQNAEVAFARYKKSSSAHEQDIAMLRQAAVEAQAAIQASAGYGPAVKLMDSIHRELDSLLEPDRARLQAFQKALQDHGSGYSQLAAASVHLEQLLGVQPDYAPVLDLRHEVAVE